MDTPTPDNFPAKFFGLEDGPRQRLGMVVGGSLTDGVEIKLDASAVIEGIAVGSYVTIDGQTGRRFYGLVGNVRLEATDPRVQKSPPADEALLAIYRGTAVYGLLDVHLHLVQEGEGQAKPVRSLPAHFTVAYRSSPEEVQAIFAGEEQVLAHGYTIGTSLEDDKVKIDLNLEKLIERSSAVFGRSGTGKTFLTLPLLAGIIKQDLAAALIFDMHNDYGWTLKGDKNQKLPGLKRLPAIAHRVSVVTLDGKSSTLRGSRPEFELKIGFDQIEPEDIESVQALLSLTEVQVNALYALKRKAPKTWVHDLLDDENIEGSAAKELIDAGRIAEGTYFAMQRKLSRLFGFDFLKEHTSEDFVERVMGHLTRGESVVVEFGRYGNDLPAYVFVANFLTRRIHKRYVDMKEAAEGGGGAEPKKLIIAIEEAHKFLEPGVAEFTIFGTIARELRKYNVTLLVVDQRPSQIDAEIMSQIGTRITCALSDEKDISAVFTGASGASSLRGVLAALDSKQQALIMGHAVPMPVAVRTVSYSQESANALFGQAPTNATLRKDTNDLKSAEPFG